MKLGPGGSFHRSYWDFSCICAVFHLQLPQSSFAYHRIPNTILCLATDSAGSIQTTMDWMPWNNEPEEEFSPFELIISGVYSQRWKDSGFLPEIIMQELFEQHMIKHLPSLLPLPF